MSETATKYLPNCVEGWTESIHTELIVISTFNIFLSVVAFVRNAITTVALSDQSYLRQPSKLSYLWQELITAFDSF